MNLKDIRLYYNTHRYSSSDLYREEEYINHDLSEEMGSAPLDAPVVGYLNTLANKVVKFMLTSRGSDAFNPNYGAYAISQTNIHQGHRARFMYDISNDVASCAAYIKATETPGPNGDRLDYIKLVEVKYLPIEKPFNIHVYLEIITMNGNRALVSFESVKQ